jgi:hypothetical protein
MRFYAYNHGRGVSFGWIGLLIYGFGWLMVWTLIIAVGVAIALLNGIGYLNVIFWATVLGGIFISAILFIPAVLALAGGYLLKR